MHQKSISPEKKLGSISFEMIWQRFKNVMKLLKRRLQISPGTEKWRRIILERIFFVIFELTMKTLIFSPENFVPNFRFISLFFSFIQDVIEKHCNKALKVLIVLRVFK